MKTQTALNTLTAVSIAALVAVTTVAHADDLKSERLGQLNMSLEDALAIALTNQPGQVIEAELETKRKGLVDKQLVWEFEIVNDADQVVNIEIDDLSGNVLDTEIEDDEVLNIAALTDFQTALSQIRATDSGTVVEVELEDDDDGMIWEIETIGDDSKKTEYRIDATTGEVL